MGSTVENYNHMCHPSAKRFLDSNFINSNEIAPNFTYSHKSLFF